MISEIFKTQFPSKIGKRYVETLSTLSKHSSIKDFIFINNEKNTFEEVLRLAKNKNFLEKLDFFILAKNYSLKEKFCQLLKKCTI